ncbi:Kua-ubiquitin conjugating enzyme hybrid, localization [Corchorus olitorius]|uniref:Kua-ubiquitin conjugating enzyme hybrid, localization n=1 Tax=Corchorus olitorius TaxID=93759 RepID=A0A1R3KBN3_9ROSI|nr:Kua-ubiquitin conjugating enzyme hybrid, localization [Corchorus olitorius]
MSLSPQHNSLRSLTYVPSCPRLCPIARVTCSATTTKSRSSQNQLLIEPRLVSSPDLVTPNNIVSNSGPPLPNDPTLQSTWSHRAWVASGCTTLLMSLAKAITGAADSHMWLEPMVAGYVGYVLADLLSGVYHWGIDNYDILCNDPVVQGFVTACAGCIMFSQQFHAWSHGTKSKLPPLVVALQDAGVLVSRSQHSAHHRPPYNSNYCIVSGVCNEFLDKNRVFEALEMFVFFKFGVRPRSWSEPGAEWTEETDERLVLKQQ